MAADCLPRSSSSLTSCFLFYCSSFPGKTSTEGITETNPYVDIGAFFTSQVIPELNDDMTNNPILKADSLKYVTTFRQQLDVQAYQQFMPFIIKFLGSDEMVLHTYASYAIER